MKETIREWGKTIIVALLGIAGSYIEHLGREKAENGNEILISQQNELIKHYAEKEKEHNEESARYLTIIATYDSLLQSN